MADQTTTPGSFPSAAQVDRSASGLAFQKYQQTMQARGAALGVGRRVAPEASGQFSNPPMSGSQFGGSSSAKSIASFSEAPGES
jgi:hypothetical protein